MIRGIDQDANRCKGGEEKDKEGMMADEICPPFKKMR